MTEPRPDRSGQLDIPLVWESERAGAESVPQARPAPPPTGTPRGPVALWRLAAAALADLGAVLLIVAAAWATGALAGASMKPGQLALSVLAGLGVAALSGGAVLWGWRGTFGMMLGGVEFAAPIPFARAMRCWVVWMLVSPLAGLPLLFGARGRRGVERLACQIVTEC